ncbi:hypothetical protein LTR85_001961 [Meristemomyces frigidus]|nr:hypothetical protein LTR85_001961 [Meristemomyces frigidus]
MAHLPRYGPHTAYGAAPGPDQYYTVPETSRDAARGATGTVNFKIHIVSHIRAVAPKIYLSNDLGSEGADWRGNLDVHNKHDMEILIADLLLSGVSGNIRGHALPFTMLFSCNTASPARDMLYWMYARLYSLVGLWHTHVTPVVIGEQLAVFFGINMDDLYTRMLAVQPRTLPDEDMVLWRSFDCVFVPRLEPLVGDVLDRVHPQHFFVGRRKTHLVSLRELREAFRQDNISSGLRELLTQSMVDSTPFRPASLVLWVGREHGAFEADSRSLMRLQARLADIWTHNDADAGDESALIGLAANIEEHLTEEIEAARSAASSESLFEDRNEPEALRSLRLHAMAELNFQNLDLECWLESANITVMPEHHPFLARLKRQAYITPTNHFCKFSERNAAFFELTLNGDHGFKLGSIQPGYDYLDTPSAKAHRLRNIKSIATSDITVDRVGKLAE